jgi:transposase
VAKGIVLLIDNLFGIDAQARAQNLDLAERDRLRQQHARPLLDAIRQQIEAVRKQALPASKLGGAVTYTLGLWERLKRFLDYPELELSNNLAENSMRGVALGRKNWIHIGSAQAGPKVAAILTVTETCRRLDIPARKYLNAVLPGLADVRISQLVGLTPAAWAARNR